MSAPTNPKKIDLTRREMPKQEIEIRRTNFNEVALGYNNKMAIEEAQRCLDCKKPLCMATCPVEIDIPTFIRHIVNRDFQAGIRTIKEKNCFPAVTGRVCPQETQCESSCVLAKRGRQIAIGRLERFLADWEASHTTKITVPQFIPTRKRVAVVGSGPAGLTAAADLIQQGHAVTIFEALHDFGGVLLYGIPEFRLPKGIVKREIDYIRQMGVKLIPDFVIGKTQTIDSLLEEYEAVFLATGAGLPWFMNIPGENLNGVYSANEYLTRMNLMKGYLYPRFATPIKEHQRVAVIGGGNVAMDCARTSLRLGAEVRVIYRRSRQELPARLEEVENAEEEGVIFEYLTLPIRYNGDENGWVTSMTCLRMDLGEPDDSGRRKPVPRADSEFTVPIDAVICAIGNSPNPLVSASTPNLEVSKHGTIIVEPDTNRTSLSRVWAGGDVVSGAATVILAMGAGRVAARAINEYLS